MISIIIVQYNNPELTRHAISSLQEQVHGDYEIVLVDNASSDAGSAELVHQLKNVIYIRNEVNFGFGKANNIGVQRASGDLLLFLNNDTVTQHDFISPVVTLFHEDPLIGIAGPRLLNSDMSFQLSAGKLPSISREIYDKCIYYLVDTKYGYFRARMMKKFSTRMNVGWVTGAALFIRKKIFESCAGFDENYFMYFEDKDLCARCTELGFKIAYVPDVSLIHLRGASSGERSDRKPRQAYRQSQIYYYRKHRSVFEQKLLRFYLRLHRVSLED